MAACYDNCLLLSSVLFMIVAQATAVEVLSLSSACTLSFTYTLNRSSTAIQSNGLLSCSTAPAKSSGRPAAGRGEPADTATTNCSMSETLSPESNQSFATHTYSKCAVLIAHESTPYLLSSDCAGAVEVTANSSRDSSTCVLNSTSTDEKRTTRSYKVRTTSRCTSTSSILASNETYTTTSMSSSCASITILKSGPSITTKSVSSMTCTFLAFTPTNHTSPILSTRSQGSCSVNTTVSTNDTPSIKNSSLHGLIFPSFS